LLNELISKFSSHVYRTFSNAREDIYLEFSSKHLRESLYFMRDRLEMTFWSNSSIDIFFINSQYSFKELLFYLATNSLIIGWILPMSSNTLKYLYVGSTTSFTHIKT